MPTIILVSGNNSGETRFFQDARNPEPVIQALLNEGLDYELRFGHTISMAQKKNWAVTDIKARVKRAFEQQRAVRIGDEYFSSYDQFSLRIEGWEIEGKYPCLFLDDPVDGLIVALNSTKVE
ncbi:MAG: hypothetical protein ACHQUB_03655 [Candidatus Saccharimonadia bacterium]